ncbi:DNA methyltransferase [Methanococcoides sp. NM1]|uniref:DNA methyltransferase n=1 Tax=Methanococcoides sp. NM1 TaxID=1201013 RepID=UPI001AEF622F|nr:DNA methyltransferase [Methanococcoides sp. NM1]
MLENEMLREECRNLMGNRLCDCKTSHLSCITAKEWLKSQIGVWQFQYEKRDIRKKDIHPAVFPLALANKCIKLFTHQGEIVLDPFVGSGTTLLAAKDLGRNSVGFDINEDYVNLSNERIESDPDDSVCKQFAICDDAININNYFSEDSIKLIMTSPPYANLLNRKRKNKSRRGDKRKNEQFDKVEQYSQNPRDLGTMDMKTYSDELAKIYENLLPLLKTKGHCIVNVPDFWMDNKRYPLHISVVNALESVGYELRNTIIWDRTNIVNGVGIFGWPSNYITMGTTFEYLLDFWKPPEP